MLSRLLQAKSVSKIPAERIVAASSIAAVASTAQFRPQAWYLTQLRFSGWNQEPLGVWR